MCLLCVRGMGVDLYRCDRHTEPATVKATIWLEYPMSKLNPNQFIGKHWKSIKDFKEQAQVMGKKRAREDGRGFRTDGHLQITFTFFPSRKNIRVPPMRKQ